MRIFLPGMEPAPMAARGIGDAVSSHHGSGNDPASPHSAKAVIARTAGAATLGGLLGGIGAERVAAMFSTGALLLILGSLGLAVSVAALAIGRGPGPAMRP